jgi:hypothetical protein
MGNADHRFRRRWLHGVSAEVKASIDGGLILNHLIELKSRLRAAFYMAQAEVSRKQVAHIGAEDAREAHRRRREFIAVRQSPLQP